MPSCRPVLRQQPRTALIWVASLIQRIEYAAVIGPCGAVFVCTSLMNFVTAVQAVVLLLLSALLRSLISVDLTSRALCDVAS
jgi:hypothetical protein